MCCCPQVSERLLGEARLLAKSLTADVERLTREKKDQADRAEAKQVHPAMLHIIKLGPLTDALP